MRLIVGTYECIDITFIIIGDKETTQRIETNFHVSLIYAFKMNSSEWQKSSVYRSCCMRTTEWTIRSQQHPAVSVLLTAVSIRVCHLVMEVGEKQRWSWAIFITSFLSVWRGLRVHRCDRNDTAPNQQQCTIRETSTLHTETHACTHTETHACTHTETHACAHTSTWQTCRALQCESTGNHPVRETEGRQWMTGMVSSLTHTGNHLTR